jgi:glycosyltransferase A (GT-A) superfamily protein (DUF2064 family)
MNPPPAQLLLVAKAPVPGQVKTRLCPPCTPAQAAQVAAAALADTVDALSATPASQRTLVHSGPMRAPTGWRLVPQRGDGLAERLVHAFADTALPGVASLLVGMDTPQVTPALLGAAGAALGYCDAVLGPARDGGWWALGLREPRHADVLDRVPMSTSDTGRLTEAALLGLGLRLAYLPELSDVDTAVDAHLVAAGCPQTRFARAVATLVPLPSGARR